MTETKPQPSLGPWLAVCYALGAVSMLVMFWGKNKLFSTAIFMIMVAVATVCLLQLLAKVTRPVAVLLLPLLLCCFFFVAFLLRAMPYLGYFGQTIAGLQRVLLVSMLMAVPLMFYGPRVQHRGWEYRQLLTILAAVLVVTQLGVLGASRWLPGWQARGLDVQTVRVESAVLGQPLVEGERAWLPQFRPWDDHALIQVNLSTGQVEQQIRLPRIEPADLGQPEWQDHGTDLRIWQGVVSRVDEDTLKLQYPTKFYSAEYQLVEQPLSILMTVDLIQGQVDDWQVLLGEEAQGDFVPGPDYLGEPEQLEVQVGEYRVFWQHPILHFQSPSKHYLLRGVQPFYLQGLGDDTVLFSSGEQFSMVRIK